MTPTMDFQDCMNDIEQAPGSVLQSVGKAVAANDDGCDGDSTATDDENDDEDEGERAQRDGR